MTFKEQQIAYYEDQRLLAFILLIDQTVPIQKKPNLLNRIEFLGLRIEQLSRS